MMPRAKKPSINKIPVRIQRISEQHLLDEKIIRDHKRPFPYFIVAAAALGILVGLAVVGYLYWTKSPAEPGLTPQIVIPSGSYSSSSSTSTTTPTSTVPGTSSSPTSTSSAPSIPPAVSQQILILDTPTGFLNVRKGPGTNTAKVGQVNPGESYKLIAEDQSNGAWYEIQLTDGTLGWITKRYAQIK